MVVTYFVQREIQYRVVSGSLVRVVETPQLARLAAATYRAWGRPGAADALEQALAVVPALSEEVRQTPVLSFLTTCDIADEHPGSEEEFERLEASVPYETWSANELRLAHSNFSVEPTWGVDLGESFGPMWVSARI